MGRGQNNNTSCVRCSGPGSWLVALWVVYGQLQELHSPLSVHPKWDGHKSRVIVIMWPQSLVQLFKQNPKVFHYKYQEQLRCLVDQKAFEIRNTTTNYYSPGKFARIFNSFFPPMSRAPCRKKDYLVKHTNVKVLVLEVGWIGVFRIAVLYKNVAIWGISKTEQILIWIKAYPFENVSN